MDYESKIKELNINLPKAADPVGSYVATKRTGNLLYISGQAPSMDGKFPYLGKVGKDITEEEGIKAAELCGISIEKKLKQ